MDKDYEDAIRQAEINLADVKERGDDAISDDWEDLEKEIFTPEEIAASNLRVAIISELIKARRERGISKCKLEELSGVKKSAIERFERGNINSEIDKLQKVLAPLGKKLAVVSI